jgi:predicted MFS family arabinose efflux permease
LVTSVWGLTSFNAFILLRARAIGISAGELQYPLFALTVLFARIGGAGLLDRIGPARSARISMLLSAAGLALIAIEHTSLGVSCGTVLFALGQATAFPALVRLALARAGDEAVGGSVIGTLTGFYDLAFALSGATIGVVAQRIGYDAMFWLSAGVTAVGFGGLLMRWVRTGYEGHGGSRSLASDIRTSNGTGEGGS